MFFVNSSVPPEPVADKVTTNTLEVAYAFCGEVSVDEFPSPKLQTNAVALADVFVNCMTYVR